MTIPQLPTEIWDRIIDDIRDHSDKRILIACALTCRSWLARVRWHLYQSVRIRSQEEAASVIRILSQHPILGGRMNNITITIDNPNDNQQWITLLPLQLAKHVHSLNSIGFTGVDPSLIFMNPRSRTAFSQLKPVPRVNFYYTVMSSPAVFAQILRLLVAMGATRSVIRSRLVDDEQEIALSSRVAFQEPMNCPSLVSLSVNLSPTTLTGFPHSVKLPAKPIPLVELFLSTLWPYDDTTDDHAHTLSMAQMAMMYQQLDKYAGPPRRLILQFALPGGGPKCEFTLTTAGASGKRGRSLGLTAEIAGWDHADIGVMARLLAASSFSKPPLTFDTVTLRLFTSAMRCYSSDPWAPLTLLDSVPPKVTAERVMANWEGMDNILSHFLTTTTRTTNIVAPYLPLMPDEVFSKHYDCVVPLLQTILPHVYARDAIPPCDDTCFFHKQRHVHSRAPLSSSSD
ncbi:hypothetical protein BXZ70DRAFT_1039020 [Cristinia sonorae]|uniref:F-box domain-containing protein n=1 Tax=Cristinia sonorae TaxID=1940300 RepID=A0A8K0UIQ3_9AGAR|nr:hypothetical protein BXZ70DRAFT_1039020 [Cristinia sonorae]